MLKQTNVCGTFRIYDAEQVWSKIQFFEKENWATKKYINSVKDNLICVCFCVYETQRETEGDRMNLKLKINFLPANSLYVIVKVKYFPLIPNHGHMVVFYTSIRYHFVSVDHLTGISFFLTDNLKKLKIWQEIGNNGKNLKQLR